MRATRVAAAALVLLAGVATTEVAGPAPALAAGEKAAAKAAEQAAEQAGGTAGGTVAGQAGGTAGNSAGESARKPIQLVLTVAKGESTAPVQRRASLTCQPPGGTHKAARGACGELARVGGQFDRLQLNGGMCTMQYDPVTVTATGTWKGRKVAYRHTFGNACTLSTTTGAVFSL